MTGRLGTQRVAWLLIANGENVKVVQESMGHANSKLTLDTYAQSSTTEKRSAQGRLIEMVLPKAIQEEQYERAG